MSSGQPIATIVVNDWQVYIHPLFGEQLARLEEQVEDLRRTDPDGSHRKNTTKLLAGIVKLALEDIPQDPAAHKFRQGNTLGKDHSHWFRANFFQQYRLFFRFDSTSKTIVYAWVNDQNTKRAYGAKQDAYRVFKAMLDNGDPPNSWGALLEAAKRDTGGLERFQKAMEEPK